MNPDISVNLLLLGKKTFSEDGHEGSEKEHEDGHDEHSHFVDGFSVQEIELYF